MSTRKEWGVFLPQTMALGEYLALGEGNWQWGWEDTLLLGVWFVLGKRHWGGYLSYGRGHLAPEGRMRIPWCGYRGDVQTLVGAACPLGWLWGAAQPLQGGHRGTSSLLGGLPVP